MLAAQSGHVEIIKLLIEKGADVAAKDHLGVTALSEAALKDHPEVESMLKDRGAKLTLIAAAKIGDVEEVNRLIQKGANVNARWKHGRTALMQAVVDNQAKILELLIEKGADLNIKDESGKTAFDLALTQNKKQMARLLKSRGAKLSLIDAVKLGDAEEVTRLLHQGVNVNARGEDARTALMQAALQNQPRIVELLIEKGADLNIKYESGKTPFDLALTQDNKQMARLLKSRGAKLSLIDAVKLGDAEEVDRLIHQGVDVNALGENGRTALMQAAFENQPKIVELLIEKGADVNIKHRSGKTALDFALEDGSEVAKLLEKHGAIRSDLAAALEGGDVESEHLMLEQIEKAKLKELILAVAMGNMELARSLLEKGVKIDAETGLDLIYQNVLRRTGSRGVCPREARWTALKLAAWSGNQEIVRLLIETGADVNATDEFGWTPLMLTAISERDPVEVVRLLIEKGADVNAKLQDGVTPLIFAASAGNLKIVKLLIQKGAEINYRCKSDWTPLMSAAKAEGDQLEIVKLFVETGSDINAKDEYGETPLSIAEKYDQPKVIQYLKEHGAVPIEFKISFSSPFGCGKDSVCLADVIKPGVAAALLGKDKICLAKTGKSFMYENLGATNFEATDLSGTDGCLVDGDHKSFPWMMAVVGVEPAAVRLLSHEELESPVSKEIESKARKVAVPDIDPLRKVVDNSSVPIGLSKKPPKVVRVGDVTLLTFELEAEEEPWQPGPTVVVKKDGQVFRLDGACTGEPLFFSVNDKLHLTYHATVTCCACGDTHFFVYDLSTETPEEIYHNSSFSN